MKLIIGLGNIGQKYVLTRHNIGFAFIELLAHEKNIKFDQTKFNGVFAKSKKFILAKPHTLMNLSGEFIVKLMNYFKIDIENVLIIYDEMDLAVGKMAFKIKGGSNFHNGIGNVINNLKTKEIKRFKIGIGKPIFKKNKVNYVLGKIKASEQKKYIDLKDIFLKAIDYFLNNQEEKIYLLLKNQEEKL